MKWYIGLGLVAVVVLMHMACSSPFESDVARSISPHGERDLTLLLFVSADNDLESAAVQDIIALETVDLPRESITVLALVDRPRGAQLYEIEHNPSGYSGAITSPSLDSSQLGMQAGQPIPLNMGNPWTLRAFVREAVASFPANNYSIVLWGHGSGWRSQTERTFPDGSMRALAHDDGSDDVLYTSQLAAGLRELQTLTDQRWGVIAFETCSAMMMEVLYEVRDTASYAVGSLDLIPASGWDYSGIGQQLREADVLVPLAIADVFFEASRSQYENAAAAAFSVVDLEAIDQLHHAWNQFSHSVNAYILESEQPDVVRDLLFHSVEDYYVTPGDLNLDMGHAAQQLQQEIPQLQTSAEQVAVALSQAVVSIYTSSVDHPHSTGIAIHYVPLTDNGSVSLPHESAYIRGEAAEHVPEFVQHSTWVPSAEGSGLLDSLWYRDWHQY